MRQDGGDGIGEEGKRHRQEDLLDAAVGAARDQQPDASAASGTAMYLGMPKSSEAAAMPANSEMVMQGVGDQEGQHGEGRAAHAEALADQVGEALAGGGAHARAHLLHDAPG